MATTQNTTTGRINGSSPPTSPNSRFTAVKVSNRADDAEEEEPTLTTQPGTSSTTNRTLIPVAEVMPYKVTQENNLQSGGDFRTPAHGKISAIENNYNSDEDEDSSEESFLDSLEEGRTPLLRDVDADDEFNEAAPSTSRVTRLPRSNYATAYRDESANAADEDPMAKRTFRRLPKEQHKVAIAGVLLFFAGLSNDVVLSFVHNRLPSYDPLPDVVFENTPYWPWALTISEYLMVTLVIILLTVTAFHRHRWIILRRIATIGSLLYFGRCVTMFVTQVPKADTNYWCSPRLAPENQTVWNIFIRGLRVLSGLGLQVNGKWTLCGDYIYSGHTIVHVTCYLFIQEYSPRRWYILHYVTMGLAAIGIFCLLTSRGHYTVDVVIAYWISTRIFWEYHTLANIPMLRIGQQGRNHLIKPIWFPLFRFMESSVMRPVPRKYSSPFRLRLFSPS